MFKRRALVVLLGFAFVCMNACIVPMAAAAQKITIKFGHVGEVTHPYEVTGKKFKELVEARTNGRVEVNTFPAGQLGNERVMLEGVQLGTVETGILSSGSLANFVPQVAVLDLLYLFKDVDEMMMVIEGPVGQDLAKLMSSAGIRKIAPLRLDSRHVYSNKEIKTPADFKGMKIRTMENPAHLNGFKALGSNPLPMAFGELYTALQQKTVDGAENGIDFYYASKHFEVAKIMSLTSHVYTVQQFVASEKALAKMPPDIQKIVVDSGKEAIAIHNKDIFPKYLAESVKNLEAKGVKIVKVSDVALFRDLAKATWLDAAKRINGGPELLKKISDQTGVKIN
jgi:TRAP-type transport system periplasmic protein